MNYTDFTKILLDDIVQIENSKDVSVFALEFFKMIINKIITQRILFPIPIVGVNFQGGIEIVFTLQKFRVSIPPSKNGELNVVFSDGRVENYLCEVDTIIRILRPISFDLTLDN